MITNHLKNFVIAFIRVVCVWGLLRPFTLKNNQNRLSPYNNSAFPSKRLMIGREKKATSVHCMILCRKLIFRSWELKGSQSFIWACDVYLISPFKIPPESHIEVIRISKMITNWNSFWSLNKFSLSASEETYRDQYGEYTN